MKWNPGIQLCTTILEKREICNTRKIRKKKTGWFGAELRNSFRICFEEK